MPKNPAKIEVYREDYNQLIQKILNLKKIVKLKEEQLEQRDLVIDQMSKLNDLKRSADPIDQKVTNSLRYTLTMFSARILAAKDPDAMTETIKHAASQAAEFLQTFRKSGSLKDLERLFIEDIEKK